MPYPTGELRGCSKCMKRILVIDDEVWLREMVGEALTQNGFEVIQAEDGATGIRLAAETLPDLILCDVNMDQLDGYKTLCSLRDQPATASIPFILMTGSADHAGMRYGMELGADDYLAKPFTLEGLFAAVDARLKKVQVVRQDAERRLADLRDNISLMLPHELRTPLNGILAYGEILASDAATLPPEEVADMGKDIFESGKRLQRLVENCLIYAQLELLGTDPEKLKTLIGKLTAKPASIIEKQARAQAQSANREQDLELGLADFPVPMAEEYLVRIVDELVENAFKFSSPGTRVRVALSESGKRVALVVSDQGRGFSTEHIRRVGAYMQFDRKLNEQQGQGLGLAIAKRLTELHGGTLDIKSEPGAGTSLTISLPRPGAATAAISAS